MLCAFIEIGFVSTVPVLLILAREFLITGLRLGAMSKGEVVSANWWGKVKTICQGISLGLFFIFAARRSVNIFRERPWTKPLRGWGIRRNLRYFILPLFPGFVKTKNEKGAKRRKKGQKEKKAEKFTFFYCNFGKKIL